MVEEEKGNMWSAGLKLIELVISKWPSFSRDTRRRSILMNSIEKKHEYTSESAYLHFQKLAQIDEFQRITGFRCKAESLESWIWLHEKTPDNVDWKFIKSAKIYLKPSYNLPLRIPPIRVDISPLDHLMLWILDLCALFFLTLGGIIFVYYPRTSVKDILVASILPFAFFWIAFLLFSLSIPIARAKIIKKHLDNIWKSDAAHIELISNGHKFSNQERIQARTKLADKLSQAREEIRRSGEDFLTAEQIEQEVAARRGGYRGDID
jgi:hypothetical protein